LDTIELSNLNRQFLFRKNDVGKYKAEVATEFIKRKFPDINIGWANNPVQDYSSSFFRRFSLIIGGLDNMEARRWLNQLVHE
jgi:ubiquitin-activating enzyme E1 C